MTWRKSILGGGLAAGIALAGLPTDAKALNIIFSPGGLSTTTTVAGVGAVVFLLLGKDGKAEKADPNAESTKATLLYLRDNHLQFVQDLAVGEGPVLLELASAARIRDENRARFGQRMQAHAAELIALSAPEQLDGHRTVRFVERYLEIAGADGLLENAHLAIPE